MTHIPHPTLHLFSEHPWHCLSPYMVTRRKTKKKNREAHEAALFSRPWPWLIFTVKINVILFTLPRYIICRCYYLCSCSFCCCCSCWFCYCYWFRFSTYFFLSFFSLSWVIDLSNLLLVGCWNTRKEHFKRD